MDMHDKVHKLLQCPCIVALQPHRGVNQECPHRLAVDRMSTMATTRFVSPYSRQKTCQSSQATNIVRMYKTSVADTKCTLSIQYRCPKTAT